MNPFEMLEIFKALFEKSFFSVPVNSPGNLGFVLTEDSRDAKLKAVEIRKVPQNSILLNMQNYPPPEKIFSGTKGERKRCDYILLTHSGGELYFIFIELKSEKLNNQDIVPQLKGGDCFIEYCLAVAEKFYDASVSSYEPKKLYVVFYPRHHLQKLTLSTPTAIPEGILHFPLALKESKGFIFFERLIYVMSEDLR